MKYASNWIDRNQYYEMVNEPVMLEGKPVPHYKPYMRNIIICLVGSSRFKEAHEEAQSRLGIEEDLIVIPMSTYGHKTGMDMEGDVKKRLDRLHFRKIDLSDGIFVVNPVVVVCGVCHKPSEMKYHGILKFHETACCGSQVFEKRPYIGASTRLEIEYAKKGGKFIRFLNELV